MSVVVCKAYSRGGVVQSHLRAPPQGRALTHCLSVSARHMSEGGAVAGRQPVQHSAAEGVLQPAPEQVLLPHPGRHALRTPGAQGKAPLPVSRPRAPCSQAHEGSRCAGLPFSPTSWSSLLSFSGGLRMSSQTLSSPGMFRS